MSILFLLIAISLLVAIIFLFGFIWAVKSGQYDDDYTPSIRILLDDQTGQDTEIDIADNDNNLT